MEGDFVWSHGSLDGFTSWEAGRPDGSGDCVLLRTDDTWRDIDCVAYDRDFVCEDGFASNPLDPDSDGDGLSDGLEGNTLGTNVNLPDSDGDGLTDDDEYYNIGTNPALVDTDGDLMEDGYEVGNMCLQPLVGDSLGDSDSDGLANLAELATGADPCGPDSDGDGLSDGDEVHVYGTSPTSSDTDGDGLSDPDEINVYGTNPTDPDTDGDGLSDSDELNVHGTDPLLPDTDGDGVNDGVEVNGGSSPLRDSIFPSGFQKLGAATRITFDALASANPSLAWNGSEFGVSWDDNRDGNSEIYFTRITEDGATVGGDIRVTYDGAASVNSSLVWNGSEFSLAWQDNRDGDNDIYFMRLAADGATLSPEVMATADAYNSRNPSLVWTGSEYGVSWDELQTGPMYYVRFARLSSTGALVGSVVAIDSAGFACSNPSLTWTGSQYGVSWQATYLLFSTSNVYFRRRNANGTASGGIVAITTDTATYSSIRPSLVWTGSTYGLSWAEQAGADRVQFLGLTDTGTKIGANLQLESSSGTLDSPSLAWSGFQFALAWQHNNTDEIYFAGLDPAGVLLGTTAVADGPANCRNPSTAFGSWAYGVAWNDDRSGNNEIYFALIETDIDGDGLFADIEAANSTDPHDWDTDDDGLSDGEEINLYLTNPLVVDSDGDGLSDGFEALNAHTNPLGTDSDGDGLSDYDELYLWAADPKDSDMDGDGLSDYDEIFIYLTNPWDIDTDDDGLADGSEVWVTGTDPLDWDSDDDGIPDGEEVGSTITDNDGDGLPGSWEDGYDCVSDSAGDSAGDPDGDGQTNLQEYNAGTDPCDPDTDADGLCDGSVAVGSTCIDGEVTRATDPKSADTDGDGLSDLVETNTGSYIDANDTGTNPNDADHDNDGFSDGHEVSEGTDPTDPMSYPATPQHLVNYQGRLTDDAGLAVGGTVNMTFRIFDVLSGGTALWEEAQSVNVQNGIYNVLLGSQTELDPDLFGASVRYLEVEVNGEPLSPRQRITSVPLAIKAEELLGGRFEIDTRPITANSTSSLTVHVSFNRAFNAPPQVMVTFQGIMGIGSMSNLTSNGFDLTLQPVEGGSGTFTYLAFGN